MLFNSAEFLCFFLVVTSLYFSLNHLGQIRLLLVSSYFFYMYWIPYYGLLMLISSGIDYFCALQIDQSSDRKRKRFFLGISLVSNLGLLFFFKYMNLFLASLQFSGRVLIQGCGGDPSIISFPFWNIILPVGISFYTFQILSYTIDVYWGKCPAERNFWVFALYVSFFPQLVAGPIERSVHLLPQFSSPKTFDYDRVADGLKLMVWGFFKKLVIADRMAIYVNQVYNHPWEYQGLTFLAATYGFALQIYCDFSAYSDIAIGAAKVLGFDLMDNFDRPYFARSVPDFWRRWHISLSTWFRDYVYIPLGGNRVSVQRRYLNIYLVFLISGFWHGANYTFLVWGALHGFYQILSFTTQKKRQQIRERLNISENNPILVGGQIVLTFHLVCFAWIFFRANHLGDALFILQEMATGVFRFSEIVAPLGKVELFYAGIATLLLIVVEFFQWRGVIFRKQLGLLSFPLRWSVYLLFPTLILMFGVFSKQEFIYFQF